MNNTPSVPSQMLLLLFVGKISTPPSPTVFLEPSRSTDLNKFEYFVPGSRIPRTKVESRVAQWLLLMPAYKML